MRVETLGEQLAGEMKSADNCDKSARAHLQIADEFGQNEWGDFARRTADLMSDRAGVARREAGKLMGILFRNEGIGL